MDRLHAMRVYVQVVECRGFAAASRQLGMSPPAVTRAIGALEHQIGSRVLVRTTRSLNLTEAGQRYFEDCKRILADVAEAEAAVAGAYAVPTGTLTVTAPILFGEMHVLPVLTEFLNAHPDVVGRTLFIDRLANIVDEGIDVAVRIGHLPDSALTAVRVGAVRRVIFGAPAYLARATLPRVPADLTKHRIIAGTNESTVLEWQFGKATKISVPIRPYLSCNTYGAAIAAAVSGWGLTRTLAYQVAPQVAAGQLVPMLTDYEEEPLPVHVVHHEGRRVSAKVRSFVDLAVTRVRHALSRIG